MPTGQCCRSRTQVPRWLPVPAILAGDCEVSIRVVPLEADSLVIGGIRPRAVHSEDLRIGPVVLFQRVGVAVESIQQAQCDRLAIVADHFRTMAARIKPEEPVIRHPAGRGGFRNLDDVGRAAIRISIGLDTRGKTAGTLRGSLSKDEGPCLDHARHRQRSIHLHVGFEFFQGGGQTFQPTVPSPAFAI